MAAAAAAFPFCGTWHRVCTSSNLGSFAPVPDSRSYVVVEAAADAPHTHTWRFGATLDALRVGYTTSFAAPPPPLPPPPAPAGAAAAAAAASAALAFTPLTVACGVGSGSAALRSDGVFTLTLLQASGVLATVVYRVLDPDTLAVSITEVPERSEAATVTTGFLFKVPHA
jgi:hypothetical protein